MMIHKLPSTPEIARWNNAKTCAPQRLAVLEQHGDKVPEELHIRAECDCWEACTSGEAMDAWMDGIKPDSACWKRAIAIVAKQIASVGLFHPPVSEAQKKRYYDNWGLDSDTIKVNPTDYSEPGILK